MPNEIDETLIEMPEEIWIRPSGWGNYLFTPHEIKARSDDTKYIQASKHSELLQLAGKMAEGLELTICCGDTCDECNAGREALKKFRAWEAFK